MNFVKKADSAFNVIKGFFYIFFLHSFKLKKKVAIKPKQLVCTNNSLKTQPFWFCVLKYKNKVFTFSNGSVQCFRM